MNVFMKVIFKMVVILFDFNDVDEVILLDYFIKKLFV